jgi:hypothetical protein
MELFTCFDIIFILFTKMIRIVRLRIAIITEPVPAYAKELLGF